MQQSVLPPTTLSQIIMMIANLDADQFEMMRAAILGSRSFEISNSQRAKLSQNVNISEDNLSYLLSGLSFLYRQLRPQHSETQSDIDIKVKSLLSDLKIPSKLLEDGLLHSRLAQLLAYSRNHQLHIKVSRLEEGFIASVVAVSSFVDLRPSFDENRSKIEGFVPIVQLMVSTDSHKSQEAQVVFQLDLDALETLRDAISDIDRKVNLLRSQNDFFLPLLTHDDVEKHED